MYSYKPIKDLGNSKEILDLSLRLKCSNILEIDTFLEALAPVRKLTINHYYDEDHQYLEFHGKIKSDELDTIAYHLLPGLEDLGIYNSKWESDYYGLMQLFVFYYIFKSLNR